MVVTWALMVCWVIHPQPSGLECIYQANHSCPCLQPYNICIYSAIHCTETLCIHAIEQTGRIERLGELCWFSISLVPSKLQPSNCSPPTCCQSTYIDIFDFYLAIYGIQTFIEWLISVDFQEHTNFRLFIEHFKVLNKYVRL